MEAQWRLPHVATPQAALRIVLERVLAPFGADKASSLAAVLTDVAAAQHSSLVEVWERVYS